MFKVIEGENGMTEDRESRLLIGWASRDVTPGRPVLLLGQFHARVSEGVMDPITVTALALESIRDGHSVGQAIMASLDCGFISDDLLVAVRKLLREKLPEVDPQSVCLNATHTHTAPDNRADDPQSIGSLPPCDGLRAKDLGVMENSEYLSFAAARIAEAVTNAWQNRAPGGIRFGLGHAVVGHNRRVSYFSGETRTYGKTDDPEFSHIEGGEDHSVNLLCTWNQERKLTGVVVNVACPSQVSEGLFQVSADYWHDTRMELRRRLGDKLFVLPQCSAAGDQSPHVQVGKAAEERMLRLAGRTQRQDIAVRIADAATGIIPLIEKEIVWNPPFAHRAETLDLPARMLSEKDVSEALAEAEKFRVRYEALKKDLETHPERMRKSRWYTEITAAYCGMLWNQGVERRFNGQKTQKSTPVEIHVLRLGQMVFATNPYEYYLDYGMQIKARSKATQTFVVQLASGGAVSYLPTERATAGRSYGALPASTLIGPEGGRLLAQRTVELINGFWPDQPYGS
jgi:hypothetical protein